MNGISRGFKPCYFHGYDQILHDLYVNKCMLQSIIYDGWMKKAMDQWTDNLISQLINQKITKSINQAINEPRWAGQGRNIDPLDLGN